MTMLRCVRIVSDRSPEEVMVDGTLKGLKDAIWLTEADDINGFPVRINGIVYILYHDDYGRLKDLPTTVIDPDGRPYLVGPVLVAKFDGFDAEESMTDADVSDVFGRVFVSANGSWKLYLEAGA